MEFFEDHVIPATNAAMEESGVNKMLTLPELKRFFGVWFLMSLHPQYSLDDFFYQDPKKDDKKNGEKKRKRDEFWDPPKCSKFMSRNLVKDILAKLWLSNDPPPIHHDRAWAICPLIKSFNDYMESSFEPSWLTCLDESMVAFLNEHCPNWVCVKRKPHPFGNEYHMIACCL
mmetsp:Transcript_20329/g.42341  ORF Transcript_20329/g.42341 Transcript_20329/m.42341 type:complete len:172 (-) Transcript_20329:1150-1665(-)